MAGHHHKTLDMQKLELIEFSAGFGLARTAPTGLRRWRVARRRVPGL